MARCRFLTLVGCLALLLFGAEPAPGQSVAPSTGPRVTCWLDGGCLAPNRPAAPRPSEPDATDGGAFRAPSPSPAPDPALRPVFNPAVGMYQLATRAGVVYQSTDPGALQAEVDRLDALGWPGSRPTLAPRVPLAVSSAPTSSAAPPTYSAFAAACGPQGCPPAGTTFGFPFLGRRGR